METITVRVLIDDAENSPFEEWYNGITDKKVRQAIASRIRRVREGPGYRLYYGRSGSTVVVLLGGGTKRRQEDDIEEAILLWERYRDEIERHSRDF